MRMVLVVMIWDFGKKKQMKYGTTSISLLNFNGQGNPGHSWLVELRPSKANMSIKYSADLKQK